jgi:hypothetical protein
MMTKDRVDVGKIRELIEKFSLIKTGLQAP